MCSCTISLAQQDAQYTQYMYNMSVINPGYATSELGVINMGGIYRSQWVSAEGGPRTGSFFGHAPIKDNMELGITFINDQIGEGIVNENTIAADFAYVLTLSESIKLSLGVKAGLNMFNTNFSGLTLPDGTLVGANSIDPAFNNIKQTFFNIGSGAFLFSKNAYLGISVPNFLPNKHLKESSGLNAVGVDEVHFFFTGGYVFTLTDNLKFKPAAMLKAVEGAPLSVDLTGNFLIFNRLDVGAAYRIDDSVSGLIGFRITPSLRIGYAYDHTLSNLGTYNTGSHEIMLLFNLGLENLSKGYEKSPRFF